jgi:hypothetical protein
MKTNSELLFEDFLAADNLPSEKITAEPHPGRITAFVSAASESSLRN